MTYRKKFTEMSKSCRKPYPTVENLDSAMSTKSDDIMFNGELVHRKRIILFTIGCGIGSCVMCPFPAESNHDVTEQNLINQFDSAFIDDDINKYDMITIFCNGNFFNEKEISNKVVEHIFNTIANSTVKSITVESLPNFLSDKKIDSYKSILGDKILQVYMGLQSANDFIRNVAINSTCSKRSFERVVKKLLSVGFQPAAFVLIKAPFLTEQEGIVDVLETLEYLDDLRVTNSTLCPMRISKNTFLSKIYDFGFYEPLNIWSVVEILEYYHTNGGTGYPMVNTTELKQDVNADSICAVSCTKCGDKVIKAIEQFLYTRNIDLFREIKCDCTDVYYDSKSLEQMLIKNSVETRVKNFINVLENSKR